MALIYEMWAMFAFKTCLLFIVHPPNTLCAISIRAFKIHGHLLSIHGTQADFQSIKHDQFVHSFWRFGIFFQAFNSHILSMNYKVFAKVNKFYKVLKWIIMMHDDKYAWIFNTWNILKMIEKVHRLVKLVQTCNNLYSLTREKSEHKEITIDTEKNGKLLVW